MPDSSATPSQHWFVIDLVEKIFEGPLTLDDLKNRLIEGKVFWSDIAMCPARDFSWIRLFEIRELVELCPPIPSPELLKHFRNVGFRQTEYVRLPLELPAGGASPAPAKRPGHREIEVPVPVVSSDVRQKQKTLLNTLLQQRAAVPSAAPAAQVRVSAASASPAPARASAPAPTPSPARGVSPTAQPASAATARSPRPTAAPVRSTPKVSGPPAEWHLLIDDNEGGPFTLREIEIAFKSGKKPERAFVWKEGMKRWRQINKVPEFKHLAPDSSYGADFADEDKVVESELELNHNVRRSFRKSFVASVLRISEGGVRQMIGVCGNITVDGFHLHQEQFRVQYPVKSQHMLEIRPLKLTKVPAFRVLAEVRWMDPRTNGIGFQFMEISPDAQKVLQRYLASVK